MDKDKLTTANQRKKKVIIYLLYTGSLFILLLGAFFGTFSVMNNIHFQVLNASVPGVVFGLLVGYLGVRYYFMVSDFKEDFEKSEEKFSWRNFKKKKVC